MGSHCRRGFSQRLSIFILILLLIPMTGCELSQMPGLMKQSLALQQQLLSTSQAMHEDMQKMNATISGMMGQIKDAAKEVGDEMLKKAFDKVLVMYMMMKKDIKGGMNEFAAMIGPQIIQSLSNVPPDQLEKIGRVFGEFLKQGGLTQELQTLNQTLSTLGGSLTGGGGSLTGGGSKAQFTPTKAGGAASDGLKIPMGNGSAGFAARNATASLRGISGETIQGITVDIKADPTDLVELPRSLPSVSRERSVVR